MTEPSHQPMVLSPSLCKTQPIWDRNDQAEVKWVSLHKWAMNPWVLSPNFHKTHPNGAGMIRTKQSGLVTPNPGWLATYYEKGSSPLSCPKWITVRPSHAHTGPIWTNWLVMRSSLTRILTLKALLGGVSQTLKSNIYQLDRNLNHKPYALPDMMYLKRTHSLSNMKGGINFY